MIRQSHILNIFGSNEDTTKKVLANDTVKKCVCGCDTDPYQGNCVGCKKAPAECACRPHSPIAKFTRNQLSQHFASRYGSKYDTNSIIQLAENLGIFVNAGGGDFLSRQSLESTFASLEQNSKELTDARQSNNSIYHRNSMTSAQQLAENYRTHIANNVTSPVQRIGGLTGDELRSVPSYAYCIHPDVRQAILNTVEHIKVAHQTGFVDSNTANTWYSELGQVKSNIEADRSLKQIRAYLSGFQMTAVDMQVDSMIRHIKDCDEIPELRQYLNDPHTRVRVEVAKKLGKLGSTELLLSMINKEGQSEPVQKTIINILGENDDIASLRSLINHGAAYVRAFAIQKLDEVESRYN